jgi:drug/metabolite transporter (DMT)-like permease
MTDGLPTAAFGALAALSLGLADFLARFATTSLGPRRTAAIMYGGGVVIFGIVALALGASLPGLDRAGLFAVVSGLAGGAGILCFYTAISRGQLSYVIPIAATYPVWSVLYAALVQGFSFAPALLAAVAVTIVGAGIVARFGVLDPEHGERFRGPVVLLAVAAAVLFVASLYLAEPAVVGSSAVGTLAVARFAGAVLIVATIRREPRERRGVPFAIAMAALDGLANLLIFLVIDRAESALAIVVSGAFGVVTVLLGRIVLKERIVPIQWAGIAMAIGGAMTVSAIGA